MFQLDELTVLGLLNGDDDSLFIHLSKFPPSLCFYNGHFINAGHAVNFLKVIQLVLFWKSLGFYSIFSILL